MISAAMQAGEGLLQRFRMPREELYTKEKSCGDFVSQADLDSQETIRKTLALSYPQYAFHGEEGCKDEETASAGKWLVDPLDGTKNFLVGTPSWSVAIALEQNKEIVAGVVYAPRLQELFYGEKGAGAWLKDSFDGAALDRRLSVHAGAILEKGVIDVYPQGKFMDDIVEFQGRTGVEIRTIGTTCLDLAYVAAGRYQAVVKEAGFGPWDLAAGALLVREAGGTATNLAGEQDFFYGKSVVAANPIVHRDLLEQFKAGRKL
jgi:myo-inositol-1(or 4)-monophosphatase